jgi:hypothetical protein
MKKTKLLLSTFILFWGIMLSCKVDLENIEELSASSENGILLKRARISFEERLKNDPIFKKYKVEPFWDKAIYLGNTIELTFTVNGEHHRPRLNENPEIIGREKLVLVESGKKFNAILVRFIPSKEYRGKIGEVNTQNIFESNFDGIVSMNVLGEEVNTLLYVSNGKIYKKINVKQIEVYKKGRIAECTIHFEQDVVVRYDSRGEWYFEYVYRSWTVCPTNGDPGGLNTGNTGSNPCDYIPALCNGSNGNGDGNGNNNSLNSPGRKPIAEFINDKCGGVLGMWNMGVQNNNHEVYGVITQSGSLLITQISPNTTGGQFDGIYEFNGTTYYFYPADGNMPGYAGTILSGNKYFIPISGTVHTHNPCMNDNTNGITDNDGSDDFPFAGKFSGINHYVLGCNGAIAQYNSRAYFNLHNGNLSSTCTFIN